MGRKEGGGRKKGELFQFRSLSLDHSLPYFNFLFVWKKKTQLKVMEKRKGKRNGENVRMK